VNVVIRGHRLPGSRCDTWKNLHVGLQVGSRTQGLVSADSDGGEWQADVEVIPAADSPDRAADYRGTAVFGQRGSRFIYLTWGELNGAQFSIVRRAKLMLVDVVGDGLQDRVVVDVDLTDEHGLPLCARVHNLVVQAVS
jgi:hypothetical protein